MELLNILNVGLVEMPAAGLADLWNNVLVGWVTPIYLAAVAIFAIMFLKDRAWMKLIGFVGIAAVVGVLVFAGADLFGSKDSGLTGVAKDAATKINTVNTVNGAGLVSESFVDLPGAFD